VTFEETLAQVIEVLRRERRVSYRALRRRFGLDEEYLADLKVEIIQAKQLATDEDDTILVWTGEATPTSVSTLERPPLTYTPAHLSEKILTTRTALEGERKQVTVLFADIKGSTELIAGLGPEEARTLLDPALRLMMQAVHRYEGTVNQVLGDGIMALFGAPLAHEDHAVRACYAALAMQEAMRRYSEEVRHTHGVEMQLRVGLNSGAVVVRAIGDDLHMDYSAVGQTTHLAARMEQLAPPGSIRLTADTLRLAEGFEQVADRQIGSGLTVGHRATLQPQPALRVVRMEELVDQARLPHPGLAEEGDHLPLASPGPGQSLLQCLDLGLPPDKGREPPRDGGL